jgi:hypothetical protein
MANPLSGRSQMKKEPATWSRLPAGIDLVVQEV